MHSFLLGRPSTAWGISANLNMHWLLFPTNFHNRQHCHFLVCAFCFAKMWAFFEFHFFLRNHISFLKQLFLCMSALFFCKFNSWALIFFLLSKKKSSQYPTQPLPKISRIYRYIDKRLRDTYCHCFKSANASIQNWQRKFVNCFSSRQQRSGGKEGFLNIYIPTHI